MRQHCHAIPLLAFVCTALACTSPTSPEPTSRSLAQLLSVRNLITSASASQRSTGGVVSQAAPDVTVDVQFNAHGPVPVKGNVNYTNSSGEFFRGDVNICYVQVANTAVFAGTMVEGAGGFAGAFFRIEVHDNGEGQASPPDLISVTSFASPPACAFTGLFLHPVIKGNLSVHKP